MLTETIDACLLRTAAERKNDERILVQIRGKDFVALEVHYHKVCYYNYIKYVTRDTKDQSESERSVSVYEKSYDVFCKEVIETEVIGGKKIMYMKDILEKFVTIAKVIENVDASKYRAFKLKQRLMKSYSQLVFCVPNLGDADYIGYTSRHLHQRIDEHRNSAIGRHVKEKHGEDAERIVNCFSVLRKCQRKFDCLLYEMLYFKQHKPGLNTQSDSIQAKVFV